MTQQELYGIIRDLMGVEEGKPLPPIIIRQIGRFSLNNDITYKEMGRCAWYYVKIRKCKIDPLYGISFVPNLLAESNSYWAKVEAAQAKREDSAKAVTKQQFLDNGNTVAFNIKEIIKHKQKPYSLKPLAFKWEEGEDDGHN